LPSIAAHRAALMVRAGMAKITFAGKKTDDQKPVGEF
jgi:hypothetical protein